MRDASLRDFGSVACGSVPTEPKPPQKPTETTFDGAQVTNAAAPIAHGERISWILGCRGCHGEKLEGGTFYERYASNLTRDLPKYSDAEIERVLRTGVPRDGRELWGMPSEIFQHLSAADLRALIADLRSTTPGGKPTQPSQALGARRQGDDCERRPQDRQGHGVPGQADRAGRPRAKYALGRYITRVTCAECHGPKLEGAPGAKPGEPPNLVLAGAYNAGRV